MLTPIRMRSRKADNIPRNIVIAVQVSAPVEFVCPSLMFLLPELSTVVASITLDVVGVSHVGRGTSGQEEVEQMHVEQLIPRHEVGMVRLDVGEVVLGLQVVRSGLILFSLDLTD